MRMARVMRNHCSFINISSLTRMFFFFSGSFCCVGVVCDGGGLLSIEISSWDPGCLVSEPFSRSVVMIDGFFDWASDAMFLVTAAMAFEF